MIYDIAIIGGGISGLYCAYQLSSRYKIIILERNNYLGGWIFTNTKYYYETGATRFTSSYFPLFRLIKELNLKVELLPT